VRQTVAIPTTATGTLSFWLKVASDETTTTTAYDTLKVQVRNSSGTVLATLATYSNLNKGTSYVQKTFSLAAVQGPDGAGLLRGHRRLDHGDVLPDRRRQREIVSRGEACFTCRGASAPRFFAFRNA
jgi:hypothetical protein